MEQFGVPKHIVGFVIPTGYSFNLVGSALYLSVFGGGFCGAGRRACMLALERPVG